MTVEGTTTRGAQRELFQGTGLQASRCWEMQGHSRIRFEVTWLQGLAWTPLWILDVPAPGYRTHGRRGTAFNPVCS